MCGWELGDEIRVLDGSEFGCGVGGEADLQSVATGHLSARRDVVVLEKDLVRTGSIPSRWVVVPITARSVVSCAWAKPSVRQRDR